MDGIKAQGRAASVSRSEAQTDEDPLHSLLRLPPAVGGLNADPWEDLLKFEEEMRAAQAEASSQSPETEEADSKDGFTAGSTATTEQHQAATPFLRPDATFAPPHAHDDLSGATERDWPPGEFHPTDRSQQSTRSADPNGDAAQGAHAQVKTPASSAGQTTAADQEHWETQLDEQAQADFERRAAIVKRRREQFAKLRQLADSAKAGDESAKFEIYRQLDGDEDLWRCFGDAEACTESQLIHALSGGSMAIEESVRRNVSEMKRSMLGETPTRVETMAVGRVVACWLFLQFIDRCATAAIQQGSRANDLGRLQEMAEKRHGISLKNFKLVLGTGSRPPRLARQSDPPSAARTDTANTRSTTLTPEQENLSSTIDPQSAGDNAAGVSQGSVAG